MNPLKMIATLGVAAALVTGVAYASPVQDSTKETKKEKKKSEKVDVAKVGSPAPAFTLKDSAGKNVSLSDFKGKVVVLEWMNPGCPVCKGKMEDGSVAKMMTESKAINPDVVFMFVNSTGSMADKPAESGDYLAKNKISAPALIDGDGTVGHAYGAKTTPHCFVIDASGVLAYAGAIDDQGDKNPANYVVSAVKALKEGKAVSPATTKSYGCGVHYAR
ncbi:MAG: redoxin family protein [Planctomycetota bacterium]